LPQLGTHAEVSHSPAPVQPCPAWHVPQLPPQPSLPHTLPAHNGSHGRSLHWPNGVQYWVAPHSPQLPPQPLLPQDLPMQFAAVSHAGLQSLSFLQISPPGHAPHWPPQPSEPHSLSAQLGVQSGPPTQTPANVQL